MLKTELSLGKLNKRTIPALDLTARNMNRVVAQEEQHSLGIPTRQLEFDTHMFVEFFSRHIGKQKLHIRILLTLGTQL
jgi:hypothetical protein